MVYISIGAYFLVMLAIGLYAYRQSTQDISGYILGGRSVSPQVTALSAGASDMSGWMLMGLPGAMFVAGYETIFIAIGLLIGALANYLLVAPKLRAFSHFANDALTIPQFFGNRFGDKGSKLRILSAVIVVVFFTLYTSAGLVAGGKLFVSAFDLDYTLGVVVTLGIVVTYTLLGGFLAVSMTDFVQGCIMFVALVLVPYVAYQSFESGQQVVSFANENLSGLTSSMSNIDFLTLVSCLAWGLGYLGQPHILVRFMAIRSIKDVGVARNIGMSWMLITILGALATGWVGVAYVNRFDIPLEDPETIFIVFSEILFSPLISGFLLAAILAAIMSTISSQLLVSASSLTEDIYHHKFAKSPSQKSSVMIGRICVFVVSAVALLLALDNTNSILSLVSNAWAGFGAAFGPVMLFALYSRNLTEKAAIAGVVSGALTVLFWIYAPVLAQGETLSSVLYEIVPGFMVSSVVIWLVGIFHRQEDKRLRSSVDEVHYEVARSFS